MSRCSTTIWRKLLSQVTPTLWQRTTIKAGVPEERFVICGIVVDRTLSGIQGRSLRDIKFGVNFALHKRANAHPLFPYQENGRMRDTVDLPQQNAIVSENTDSTETHPIVLKGILKGCAEQNAIGVLAANGIPYSAIRKMYILALEQRFVTEKGHGETLRGFHDALHAELFQRNLKDSTETPRQTTPFLPCQACTHHLDAIGHHVQKRSIGLGAATGMHLPRPSIDVFTMQNLNIRSVRHLKFPQPKSREKGNP